MSDLHYTAHAEMRMSQRGITGRGLEMVALIGTEVEGGYLVREKDFQAFERELKHLRDQARKLVGKRVVIDGDRVVTAYHANNRKERQLLRHVSDGGLQE